MIKMLQLHTPVRVITNTELFRTAKKDLWEAQIVFNGGFISNKKYVQITMKTFSVCLAPKFQMKLMLHNSTL